MQDPDASKELLEVIQSIIKQGQVAPHDDSEHPLVGKPHLENIVGRSSWASGALEANS